MPLRIYWEEDLVDWKAGLITASAISVDVVDCAPSVREYDFRASGAVKQWAGDYSLQVH
jgi:hypothetical protein